MLCEHVLSCPDIVRGWDWVVHWPAVCSSSRQQRLAALLAASGGGAANQQLLQPAQRMQTFDNTAWQQRPFVCVAWATSGIVKFTWWRLALRRRCCGADSTQRPPAQQRPRRDRSCNGWRAAAGPP
ncbi:hypothetical protein HYH02_003049 [Chlamydomonas schloesseri]|uniref:Uncharacterized protein n=1 Tax=Chlamydomonas schloesseri TaxID=2026947 RepID=A0A835WQF7_9CHLO|nr:hypothetical protein HYH02_003049 [Chlamydomonas schloesseri]|eukprot:KAG2452007.1 hypothetical protein HYH02_003049 [Chlamydomonas schloesseri]